MAEVGLAWPNQPDIDVQTLAGSFSTATHGTGLQLPALHANLVGLRLVTASGEILPISRERDPELFAAAQVSLGALGIITECELQVEDVFLLRRRLMVERVEDLLDRAFQMAQTHRNFEFYYLPNTGYAASIVHDRVQEASGGRAPSEDDQIIQELRQLRDLFGWWPWLRRAIFSASAPLGVIEDSVDESWRMLSTARPIRFNEMEYHLPLEAGMAGVRETISALDRRPDVYFPAEFRWTAGDSAWLSPFNGGPRVSIATHAGVDERYEFFFEELEPMHLEKGGRPHWGKLHRLSSEQLRSLYPKFQLFTELREELDPEGKFLNPHLAHLFGVRDA